MELLKLFRKKSSTKKVDIRSSKIEELKKNVRNYLFGTSVEEIDNRIAQLEQYEKAAWQPNSGENPCNYGEHIFSLRKDREYVLKRESFPDWGERMVIEAAHDMGFLSILEYKKLL